MILQLNDDGSTVLIRPESPRDIIDLSSVLHRLGNGPYDLQFIFPDIGSDGNPRIELTKTENP